jgi:hypothetical protein
VEIASSNVAASNPVVIIGLFTLSLSFVHATTKGSLVFDPPGWTCPSGSVNSPGL